MKKSTVFINFKKWARSGIFFAVLLFCLFSLVFFTLKKEDKKVMMSGISVLYVFLPSLAQRLFKFRVRGALYLFVMAYTVCPLIGYAYGLYYTTSWWDDVLHAFAGVLFAMFGAYLPTLFCKNGEIPFGFRAFCAFSFSVAIAGLWELVEFSMDTFFLTDMQKDTLLTSLRPSYLLSELVGYPVGVLGDLNGAELSVNGQTLAYCVDFGLIDSMQDIFIETLGAAVYTALYCVGKGKRFAFESVTNPKPLAAEENTELVEAAVSE